MLCSLALKSSSLGQNVMDLTNKESCVSFEKRWTGVNQNVIICGVNWTAVNCANSVLRSYDSKVPDVRTANQVVTKWSSIYASY